MLDIEDVNWLLGIELTPQDHVIDENQSFTQAIILDECYQKLQFRRQFVMF